MAERRMFARSIIESDPFMDMPPEAQMLYIRLNMAADDDGFCDNPRSIMRSCGASNDSMKILIAKKFVLTFEKKDNFIVVIKHWRMNNYIRKDTYHETKYKEFMRELYYDENQSYSLNPGDGHVPCIPGSSPAPVSLPSRPCDVSVTDTSRTRDDPLTQDRLGEDKGRIGQDREEKDSTVQGSQEEKGSGGKQTALPAPAEKPVESSAPANGETDGRIDFFAKQILLHKRHGYKTDVLYSWAANEGYSAAVIDDRIIQLEQQKEAERS